MKGDCFLDVVVQLAERLALGKYVIADAPRAPGLPIEVGLYLDEHMRHLSRSLHAIVSESKTLVPGRGHLVMDNADGGKRYLRHCASPG